MGSKNDNEDEQWGWGQAMGMGTNGGNGVNNWRNPGPLEKKALLIKKNPSIWYPWTGGLVGKLADT